MKKKQKLGLLVVGLVVATVAYAGIIVHGQLVDASLENLSSDPTAHTGRVYFNTSTNAAKVYNGTAWSGLGGAGAGEKNYLSAGSSSNTGWAASGAGVTCTTPTTNLPDPSVGTALGVTGVSGLTAFCYASFAVDDADFNKKMKLAFDQFAVAGYAASDMRVDVCTCAAAFSAGACSAGTVAQGCGTNATRLALSTDSAAVSALPALTGTYRTTWDSPGSTQKYIQVQVGLNGANTHQLNLANVVAGPGVVTQGAAVTDWISYTPTFTAFGTVGSPSVFYKRIGRDMYLDVTFTAGTLTGATNLMSLPAGLTVDGAVVGVTATPIGVFGSSSNTATINGLIKSGDTTDIGFCVQGNVFQALTPATYNSTTFTGTIGPIPIAQWAGSGTVNVVQNDLAYYSGVGTWGTTGTPTLVQGPGGSLGGTTTPAGTIFTYTFTPAVPVPVGAAVIMQASSDGTHWSAIPNAWAGAGIIEGLRYDGTNYIGAAAFLTTTGTIQAQFGKYAYGTSGAWNGTWYWRVAVGLPGQAVGFSNVTQTSAGLVKSAGQLLGTNTNDTAIAGNVGETFSASISTDFSFPSPASDVYQDITGLSITPTAGDFRITATIPMVVTITNANTSSAFVQGAIRSGASTLVASAFGGMSTQSNTTPTTQYIVNTMTIVTDVQTDGTKTYKLSAFYQNQTGTPTVLMDCRGDLATASIVARRVR